MANTRSKHEIINSIASIADSLITVAMYIHFLWDVGIRTLQQTSRFILFPVGFFLGIIKTGYAIRRSYLAGREDKRSLIHAIIELVTALISGFGVVVGLGGAALGVAFLAAFLPMIFVGVLGFKTLYHTAIAFFCWGKSSVTTDQNLKQKYLEDRNDNAKAAFSLLLSTLAVGIIMLAGIHLLAPLGIAAGVISGIFAVMQFCKEINELWREENANNHWLLLPGEPELPEVVAIAQPPQPPMQHIAVALAQQQHPPIQYTVQQPVGPRQRKQGLRHRASDSDLIMRGEKSMLFHSPSNECKSIEERAPRLEDERSFRLAASRG